MTTINVVIGLTAIFKKKIYVSIIWMIVSISQNTYLRSSLVK